MKHQASKLIAIAVVIAELASVGLAATSASAQDAGERQIRRQQQIILRQQREILANQRRLAGQKERFTQRSPVTGEPIDERKLPKGLLSGVLPACPLGFAYNPFVGCVLYVAH